MLAAHVLALCAAAGPANLWGLREVGPGTLAFGPELGFGQPVKKVGAGLSYTFGLDVFDDVELAVRPAASVSYRFDDWGIDESSVASSLQLRLTLGFGAPVGWGVHAVPVPRRQQNFSYYSHGYLSSNGTSQITGGFIYEWAGPRQSFQFVFENDMLGGTGFDEYRTGAGALRYRRLVAGGVFTLGARATVWTASTGPGPRLDRGEFYDLTGKLGADNTHGIIAAEVGWEGFRFAIGWDSEDIRRALQDTIHDAINDGRIPPVGRPDRLFVSLELGGLMSEY